MAIGSTAPRAPSAPPQRTQIETRAFCVCSTPKNNSRSGWFVQSNKFDDHCAEFALHEDLDASGALLTATLDNETGDISDIALSASGTAGLIPLTVPSSNSVSKNLKQDFVYFMLFCTRC